MVPSVWLATAAASFPESLLTVVLTSSIHEVVVFCSNIRGFCNYLLQDNEYFLLPSAAMQAIQHGVRSGPYTAILSITQKMSVPEICQPLKVTLVSVGAIGMQHTLQKVLRSLQN